MLPIRDKEPLLSETGLSYSQTLPLKLFGFYLVFLVHAAFEIIVCTNTHTRHIKPSELNKLLMVHDYINQKYGSYLKYLKYSAFTLPGAFCVGVKWPGCGADHSSIRLHDVVLKSLSRGTISSF
jgi:hypothetical protein